MTPSANSLLPGPGAALVTLRGRDGSVDEAAMARLAATVASAGIASLLVAGTTGESHACTLGDRLRLVSSVARAGVPVVVGLPPLTSGRLLVDLRNAGACAALAGSADGLEQLAATTEASGLALLAYHHPHRGLTITADQVRSAAAHGLAGVKDSSGDLSTLAAFTATGLPVLAGGTAVLARAKAAGASGLLSGLGSAFPHELVRAWDGDDDALATLAAFERANPDRIAALRSQACRLIAGR